MASRRTMTLTVNDKARSVEVASNETLLETLRRLGAVEVKCGCEKGDCGACAVLLDGMAVDSCLTLTGTVGDRPVTTVKGLGDSDMPHPLQTAFSDRGAAQCGYCTPGMIIAAQSMLTNDTADPDESDIRLALSGNLCRCTGYTKIYDAVLDGARAMRTAETTHAEGVCPETVAAPSMETVK
jgi:carbon-monoxide dehydrogenase small subunit